MPYIPPQLRPDLDQHIAALAEAINSAAAEIDGDAAYAGLLNYSCTRLALETMPARRYWAIATTSGVFHNIADEFYRRFAGPYEDEQIARNGDVYDTATELG
ncbi:MAG TPA: hypothetical protein VL595_33140 [Pseudonocardia sp.]|nr:hypothetical protein [Pseudonocardia sp.]